MSNPFVGFEIFTKRHNGNGNNGHPFGEDSHLDDDSILERPGDVDTGENYMEPPDFDDDDLDDIKDQATLPRNVRQAIESRDSEANFSEPDDYDYEPEVNQAQRNWKEETEQRDEELDKPRKLPQSEVYDPETDSYTSENLSGDDFVKALGNAIDTLEKQMRHDPSYYFGREGETAEQIMNRQYDEDQIDAARRKGRPHPYSHRDFVDPRTPEEIRAYDKKLTRGIRAEVGRTRREESGQSPAAREGMSQEQSRMMDTQSSDMEMKQGIGDVARKVGKKVGRAVTYKDPRKRLKRESDAAGPQNTPEKRQAAVARLQEYQGEKAKGDRWGRGPKPPTSSRSRSRQNESGDIEMSHDSFVKL